MPITMRWISEVALADQEQRRVAVEALDLVLLRVAVAAVDAEALLDALLAGLRGEELRHPGLEVGALAGVLQPRRLAGEEASTSLVAHLLDLAAGRRGQLDSSHRRCSLRPRAPSHGQAGSPELRRGTRTSRLNSATRTPSWFSTRVWTLTTPRSGFDFEGLTSSTSGAKASATYRGLRPRRPDRRLVGTADEGRLRADRGLGRRAARRGVATVVAAARARAAVGVAAVFVQMTQGSAAERPLNLPSHLR